MKKLIALLCIAALVLSFSAVAFADTAAEEEEEPVELIVFAAASMTEAMNNIIADYEALYPNVTIIATYDSSGTLKTQIQEGADCDIFISAGQKQMNQLDITADESVNTDKLDFVIEDTRFNILENKCALCLADNTKLEIASYDDLAEMLADDSCEIMLAMGNSDVPVGQYTQKILAYYDLSEEDLAAAGKITYGSNVKEVTTAVSEGTVACGIIYASDAYSANLTPVALADAEMTGGRVIYPAAVLNITQNEEAARAFLEYLKGEEASARLAEVLFTPLSTVEEEPAA